MKFSDYTLSVLKNFSYINPSIVFKPGDQLKTMSPNKTIVAIANVGQTFETSAAVYDLSRFLSTLSLFNDPEIKFGEDRFTIVSGRSKLNYTYASESMIVTAPDKEIKLPDPECTCTVEWEDIQSVVKAASALQLSEIAFKADGTKLTMEAVDTKNPTADNFIVDLGNIGNNQEFEMVIKVEHLKLLPSKYDVSLSTKGLAQFKSENITYYIALEAK